LFVQTYFSEAHPKKVNASQNSHFEYQNKNKSISYVPEQQTHTHTLFISVYVTTDLIQFVFQILIDFIESESQHQVIVSSVESESGNDSDSDVYFSPEVCSEEIMAIQEQQQGDQILFSEYVRSFPFYFYFVVSHSLFHNRN
jgi:hypothetical protein